MAELTLTPEQRALVDRLLFEPFSTLSSGVSLDPVAGEGYPALSVSEEDRNGDGIPDEWIVERPLDDLDAQATVRGDEFIYNPRDGYLVEQLRFHLEDDPRGPAKVLVYDARAFCRNPDNLTQTPTVCRQYSAVVTDWGRQRFSENFRALTGFVTEFIQPHHPNLPFLSAADYAYRQDAAATATVEGLREEVDSLQGTLVGLLIAAVTLLAGVVGGAVMIIRRIEREARGAVVPEAGQAEPWATVLPEEAFRDEGPVLSEAEGPRAPERAPAAEAAEGPRPELVRPKIRIPAEEGGAPRVEHHIIGRWEGDPLAGPGTGTSVVVLSEGGSGERYFSISRQHAEVEVTSDGQIFIRDNNSRGGTRLFRPHPDSVRGDLIEINPVLFTEIRPGDILRFGGAWYSVRLHEGEISFEPYAASQQRILDFRASPLQLPVSPDNPGSVYLGRTEGPGIIGLPNANRDISRRHAEIGVTSDGRYLIQTASQSRMGEPVYLTREGRTFVVPVGGWVELRDGDLLEFGSRVYLFQEVANGSFAEVADGLQSVSGRAYLTFVEERPEPRSEELARIEGITDYPEIVRIDAGDEPVRLTVEAQAAVADAGLDRAVLIDGIVREGIIHDPSIRIAPGHIDDYRRRQLEEMGHEPGPEVPVRRGPPPPPPPRPPSPPPPPPEGPVLSAVEGPVLSGVEGPLTLERVERDHAFLSEREGRNVTLGELIDRIGLRQARRVLAEIQAAHPEAEPMNVEIHLLDALAERLGLGEAAPAVPAEEAPPSGPPSSEPDRRLAPDVPPSAVRTGLDDIDRSRELPYESFRAALTEGGVTLDPEFETNVRTVGDLVDRIGRRRASRIYSSVEASRGALVGGAFEQAFLGELLASAIERDHGPIEVSRRPELVRRFEEAILGRETGREARGRLEGREAERPRETTRRPRSTPRRGR